MKNSLCREPTRIVVVDGWSIAGLHYVCTPLFHTYQKLAKIHTSKKGRKVGMQHKWCCGGLVNQPFYILHANLCSACPHITPSKLRKIHTWFSFGCQRSGFREALIKSIFWDHSHTPKNLGRPKVNFFCFNMLTNFPTWPIIAGQKTCVTFNMFNIRLLPSYDWLATYKSSAIFLLQVWQA